MSGFEAQSVFRLNAGGRDTKGAEGEWDDVTKRFITRPRRNVHPTVKPIKLTTYLATLLLPPELDEPRKLLVPFSGSGSEMIGGHLAGWDQVTGIELDDEYIPLSQQRVGWWSQFSSYEEAEKSRSK